jgi:quinol monooxygenase YgiN
MFVVTVTFEAAPQHAEAFLARVRRQAADSLTRETGCLRFDVCTDPEQPGRVFLYELYASRAAFGAHLASAHFRAFDREVAPWIEAKKVESWELRP